MAPSKVDVENAVESSKRKESEDEALSSVLYTDTCKDLAGLETCFSQIQLCDRPVQELLKEEINEEEPKEKGEIEEERDSEKKEVNDSEKEINTVNEGKTISYENEKLPDHEVIEECKEKEDGQEEEEEEKEEVEKEEKEMKKEEEIKKDEEKLKDEEERVVLEDESLTKSKVENEEEEEEEEVSDDENPADEGDQKSHPEPKDRKLRSRGFGYIGNHGCPQTPHMNYMGYPQQQQQQQQQQPPQNQMWHQPTFEVYSPQHGQEAGFPGTSPNSAMGEGEDDMPNGSYGYNAESPQSSQDMYTHSPQYQENQPSPYQQDFSHSQSIYYHQQQDNQASPFHQGLPQGIQYQENQGTPYHQGSPQLLPAMPYNSDLACQEALSPMQVPVPSNSYSIQSPEPHSSILTPPISPQPEPVSTPISTSQVEDIAEIINSVLDQEPFDISPHDSRIIDITRTLMDMKNGCHPDLEEDLDETRLDCYFRQFARLKNEALIEGDEDGDILYAKVLCTGQTAEDYNEKIAAFTQRVEKMDLCCSAVVDWRVKKCLICGNSDPNTFYSPLSWINDHGQMPLSNMVILLFPGSVIKYLTRKVMQKPMDLIRTFTRNYELFEGRKELYPCLIEGLNCVENKMGLL